MCSLAEGGFLVEAQEEESSLENKVCQKCKNSPAKVKLRRKDVYCVECFIAGSKHKFRSTLGKNKVMIKDDKVLVPFNGDQNSVSMVDLIHSSLRDNNLKRHFYTVTIFIADFDFAGNGDTTDTEKRQDRVEKLKELVKGFEFEIRVGNLEAFLRNDLKLTTNCGKIEPSDELTKILTGFRDGSAKEDFLKQIESKMNVQAARMLGCNKIFECDCASDLAVSLMAGCATGRGINLPDDTGFADNRFGDELMVLRPMREFSSEEVSTYIKVAMDLQPIQTQVDESTIKGLTHKFLFGLQANFPATIPTIFRTTGKLLQDQSDERCRICDGNKNDVKDSPSVEATEFSRYISSVGTFNKEELSSECLINGELPQGGTSFPQLNISLASHKKVRCCMP